MKAIEIVEVISIKMEINYEKSQKNCFLKELSHRC